MSKCIEFQDDNWIEYVYDASGVKRKARWYKSGIGTTTKDYVANKVYENNALKMVLHEDFYISYNGTGGSNHYYLKDHLGNNRVVLNGSGGVVQATNYYPFGLSMAENPQRNDQEVQAFKYNGKELDRENQFDTYDYGARMYAPAIGRFMTMDPMAEKYYSISPYAYCGNNPVNAVDLRGDSITVLNLGSGTNQHLAILIQNDAGKWQYYSVNGDNVRDSGGNHTGGREFDDVPAQDEDGNPVQFDSPQQFMDSYYNQKGDKGDKSKNSYGFTEGFVIPTTKEQDKTISKSFIEISKEEYRLNPFDPNQCATAVQRSLNAAGVETRQKANVFGPTGVYRINKNPYLPSAAYGAIKNNNLQGYSVYKNKKN